MDRLNELDIASAPFARAPDGAQNHNSPGTARGE
jgi:hypothetical protein